MPRLRLLLLCLVVLPAAARAQQVLFDENWEMGTNRWKTIDNLNPPTIVLNSDTNICSSKYAHETLAASRGRVIGTTGIPVTPGQGYCVTAWMRGSAGAGTLLGINKSSAMGTTSSLFDEHWLIGEGNVPNGYGGSVVPIAADGAWHWYASQFVPEAQWNFVVIKFQISNNGYADFDDIRLYQGGCPQGPVGSAHMMCAGATPLCSSDGRCVQCTSTNTSGCGMNQKCDLNTGVCYDCTNNSECGGNRPYCDPNTRLCVGCYTNGQCSGSTPACDLGTRTCVGCTGNSFCSGTTAYCDTTNKVCVGCVNNTHCKNPTPVCSTQTKTCVGCSANTDCGGTTPICDQGKKACVGCVVHGDCKMTGLSLCDPQTQVCVGCLKDTDCATGKLCNPQTKLCETGCVTDTDCGGATPACQPSRTCGQCSSTNTTQCAGAKPLCDTTAGVCVPCVAGNNQTCANSSDGKTCLGTGGMTFCGCTTDAECGTANSGRVCDTKGTRKCIPGCSPAPGRNTCPQGQFCSTNDITGNTIGTCGNTCVFDADCATATPDKPFCVVAGTTRQCVACRTSSDCKTAPKLVCTTDTFTCVECTTATAGTVCRADGKGAACLSPQNTCGCNTDADCGGTTSGRICDATSRTCAPGCRGTGGNGCPTNQSCSTTDNTVGTCGTIRVTGGGCDVGRGAASAPLLALFAFGLFGLFGLSALFTRRRRRAERRI